MRMREFIRTNRAELDKAIDLKLFRYDGRGGKGVVPTPPPRRNDGERELCVVNDESLYHWAQRSGVKI